MRSYRDEAIRYREESKRFQAELAAVRSKKVIGIPESRHRSEIEKLKRKNEGIEKESERIRALSQEQRREIKSIKGDNQTLKSQLAKAQECHQKDIEKLNLKNGELLKEVERLNKLSEDQKNSLKELNGIAEENQSLKDHLDRCKDKSIKELEELIIENDGLYSEIEKLKHAINDQRDDVDKASSLKKQNAALQEQLTQCNEQLKAERARRKEQAESMQAEINSRDNAIRRLRRGN